MEVRVCKICGIEKPLNTDNFQRNAKPRKDGTIYYCFIKTCRVCQNEKQLPKDAARREKERDKRAATQKIYYQNNKEACSFTKKQCYQNKKTVYLARIKLNTKIRRKNDLLFRLKERVSCSIWLVLKGKKEGKSIKKYLPYTIEELKQHLESLFEPWMTWDNWGKYDVAKWNDNDQSTWAWNIDHIIPHSKFIYTSMEDQSFRDCWALSNLRPYSAKQNIIDGDR